MIQCDSFHLFKSKVILTLCSTSLNSSTQTVYQQPFLFSQYTKVVFLVKNHHWREDILMVLLKILNPKNRLNYIFNFKMAKSTFEYVKKFELDDSLLPNCWIVVRLDGKCFHKFATDHKFEKPNDIKALNLMNHSALSVLEEFHDLLFAYGQSDEYSFIFKKNTNFYNRRESKILTTIVSKFSSAFVFHWKLFFDSQALLYPPAFDGRVVLYPTDQNLVDYLSWRQADVHVNNLYNTTFWNLVLKGNMTPEEAENRLRGTLAADKNEIMFSEFNINYNNEPNIFKKGTILLKKLVLNETSGKHEKAFVNMHTDFISKKFWDEHYELLECKNPIEYKFKDQIPDFVKQQLDRKKLVNKK